MQKRIRYRPEDSPASASLRDSIQERAQALETITDLQPLIDFASRHEIVMLGEASHGTADFYIWRSEISKKLIAEGGFSYVVVEGDWPDCFSINQFVKGAPDAPSTADEVLKNFKRWPTWMWANEEVRDFMEWLRDFNQSEGSDVGFYGLDVYSLWDSLHEVTEALKAIDPSAYQQAQKVLHCFHEFGTELEDYANQTAMVPDNCEESILRLLLKVRQEALQSKVSDSEVRLSLAQNAQIIRNAEAYYRSMFRGGAASWNLRDMHMGETLERLHKHYHGRSKGIVWAHNTHIGDARYTDMASVGMLNLGQLGRESYGEDKVCLIGFATYEGSVIAGRGWDRPAQRMRVPPARAASWEATLHETLADDAWMIFPKETLDESLEQPRGHRAIGVVYHPENESGQYVPTVMPRRYDALIYLDKTEALHPIASEQRDDSHEPAETFPSGV